MRLIDADTTKANVKMEHTLYSDIGQTIRQWIDCQPTVAAIPVEWLTDLIDKTCYADKNGDGEGVMLHVAARLIYDKWQKEHEEK